LNAAKGNDPGDVWFASLQQTAGRGRRGRTWESPPGNLAASLLIKPDVDPATAATLGFVAGVALNRALGVLLPAACMRVGIDGADGGQNGDRVRIALKWPNDVLADGAKLAGILLEASKADDGRQAIVIGFGVNIVAAPVGLPYPATCVRDLGAAFTAEDVFERLGDSWLECIRVWRNGNGMADILEEWRDRAAGLGAPVAVNQNGDVVRGIFETVDSAGRLIVRQDNGRRITITAGDVHFGATAGLAH